MAGRGLSVLGVLALAVALGAGVASAAPVSYYGVPGTGDQPIANLTAASDGTLWMTQRLSDGPANNERHMRLLRVDAAGNLVAVSPEIEGDPIFTELKAASDGGVWALVSGALLHVTPAGAIEEVAVPAPFDVRDLSAGSDGRAWALACRPIYSGEVHEEECEVLAAAPDGGTEFFPAPALEVNWPAGAKSMWSTSWAVPAGNGTWFTRLYVFGSETSWSAKTVFVSSAGVFSEVSLPSGTYVTEGAPGDSAWWLRSEGTAGATIGEVDKAGLASNTQHLDNVSAQEPPDSYSTASGRNNDLIWAQNATWSDTLDGQLGVRRLDGSSNVFQVQKNETAVLLDSEANFWSGSCVLGSRLYEATDGSLWTLSFGHPSRVTRQQPSGEFSTFLIGDSVSREEEVEIGTYGLSGLVETDSRSLWFTRNLPGGPQLAKLDPLDPPPAEVKYPGSPRVQGKRALTTRERIDRLLRSLVKQSKKGFARQRRLWIDRRAMREAGIEKAPQAERVTPIVLRSRFNRFALRGRFPVDGRAIVSLRLRGKHKHVALLALGSRSAPSGRRMFSVRLLKSGRNLMRRQSLRSARLLLSASFKPKHGKPSRRSARLGMR